MKSILMISHSSNKTGGGEGDFQKLLEYFHGQGYEIYSVFPEGYSSNYYKSLSKDYLVLPDNILPFNTFNLKKYLMFIYFTIMKLIILLPFLYTVRKKIDVCFVNSSVCLSEIIALNIAKIPFVLSIKELISPLFIRKLLYSYYNKSSHNVIVISEFLMKIVSDYFDSSKIHLIRSSLNENEANEMKARYKPKARKEFTILNSGVITPIKNQLLLLKALSNVKVESPIIVNIIGRIENHSYNTQLIEYSSSIGKKNINVYFLGEIERGEALKQEINADLIVITSCFEGMSLVLAESLFFGKPIISTKTGAAEEVINHGINGFLIDFDDYIQLSGLIDLLINDFTLRNKMSLLQYETYTKYFSSVFYLEEHERILLKSD